MFDAPTTSDRACRHCGERVVSRPRRLCWGCYYAPGVRDLYPTESRYGYRGTGNGNHRCPLPEPTDARPGTPEKLAVLAHRAAAGNELWHPDDAKQ